MNVPAAATPAPREVLLRSEAPPSLPAVHLFELPDAGAFDRCGGRGGGGRGGGGRGGEERQGGGAAASWPQLLSGDRPHGARLLLLGFVRLVFDCARGHGLQGQPGGQWWFITDSEVWLKLTVISIPCFKSLIIKT